MLSHVRRERFFVITLIAVENKRSGAVEVAGIASTRLTKTLKPREKMHSTVTPLVERIRVLGRRDSASLPYLDLPVSNLCA